MEFRVDKVLKSKDPIVGSIRAEIAQASAHKLELIGSKVATANGDGSNSLVYLGLVAGVGRWRVVGIGGYVVVGGLSTKPESMWWGYRISDIGALDSDAFGSIVCNTTADKELTGGDIIYQGISPFEDVLGFDALVHPDTHTWTISGAGAGVKMGVWQTKASMLSVRKENVADSDATIIPFVLVEYESGEGVK